MTERPRKQEQEPATDEITEVAPGILRMQLPIALPGLGHVNCYALEDGDGVAIVDPGLPGPESWIALTARLKAAGFPLARVHTVIVTHSHPDHFGGARQMTETSGARVVTHELFRNWWDPNDDGTDDVDSADTAPDEPAPEGFEGAKVLRRVAADRWFAPPRPNCRLHDTEPIMLAGREFVSVHTPGHTPDHLCLLDPTTGTMLSGDHILPTITPHISGVGAGPDPLADFFASLDHMKDFPEVTTVLPAHGHPFTDLAGRADDIRIHHLHRLDVLRAASAALGPASVRDLSHELFQERSWGHMAESETYAHLEHLRLADEMSRTQTADGPLYAMLPA